VPTATPMLDRQLTGFLSLLEGDGWSYQEVNPLSPEDRWWIASCVTPRRKIVIHLAAGGGLLGFQLAVTNPENPPAAACRGALWRFLLRLNHEIKLAKLTLGADGVVFLAAELPLAGLAFATFREALVALRTYFEHYHREIELLASNAAAGEAWLSFLPVEDEPVEVVIRPASPAA
jgi:hypothetical protein